MNYSAPPPHTHIPRTSGHLFPQVESLTGVPHSRDVTCSASSPAGGIFRGESTDAITQHRRLQRRNGAQAALERVQREAAQLRRGAAPQGHTLWGWCNSDPQITQTKILCRHTPTATHMYKRHGTQVCTHRAISGGLLKKLKGKRDQESFV